MAFTFNSIEPISLMIGIFIMFIVWLIIFILNKVLKKKKEPVKTSLPTLKNYVKQAHSSMVDAANNLIKLYEVFNDIDSNEH